MRELLEARSRYLRLLDSLSNANSMDDKLRKDLRAAVDAIDAKLETAGA